MRTGEMAYLIFFLIHFLNINLIQKASSGPVKEADVREWSSSINKFSIDMVKDLSVENGENLIISPISVATAFSMLFLGAEKNTREEIAKAFYWNEIPSGTKLLRVFAKKMSYSPSFSMVNNAWIEEKMKLKQSYVSTIEETFGVQPQEVAFSSDSENARKEINNWVAEKTGNEIKDLLPPDSVNSLTRLVLANAVHFKGVWETPFDPKLATPAPFYINGGKKMEMVTYMFAPELHFHSYDDVSDSIRLVELPYAEKKFSFVIAMPKKNSVNSIAENLDRSSFDKWMKTLQENKVKVDLLLPKFEIESRFDLVEYLQKKKIQDLFTPGKADLSGISADENLYCSQAFHQADIKVDETGTKASGGTTINLTYFSARASVTIDRPFLYFIVHKEKNTIVFAGKVMNPSK